MRLSLLIKILQDTAADKKRDGIEDPEVYVTSGVYLYEVLPMNARDVNYVRIKPGDMIAPDMTGARNSQ